jgi:hypothetical protein
MRALLVTLVGLSLGLPPMAVAAPSSAARLSLHAAAAAPEADKSPEVLYDEGKKAYHLGKFGEAVLKWEQAYSLSERSLLLYNISLAYKGRYEITDNLEDLRKARAVMKNFLVMAQADPDMDPDDAPERIAELDGMIADVEANRPDEREPQEPVEPKPIVAAQGPDPGRTLRIAGASAMGGGGLLLVTGGVLGIFFGVRGKEFSDELGRLEAGRDSFCGDPSSTECAQQNANIQTANNNGRKADLGLGLSLGIGGGLGLVGLGAGVILFVQGNHRTTEWKKTSLAGRLRLVPTGRGLALHGRF